ncbi:solute carrier family 22 member 18 isoform X1 [Gopherus flavomarginatus]|uniref:solute carrier family 22 member 18 isoform X1 n=1 Tax=Gopherus flavomarginatus TaxID=286002 RepID=UPI0021CC1158|nr:solute carrier family 22 member 18 isoform X1 [Gopherus flavomarginatus]XP_050809666.1 solute carrier family 22 member 18 isoform X1 [Gopherus flavomarginatus]XP_050809667.1 solute carrier family 22 member 18 isoform X1 [Gopherus flavomarginatus]
MFSTNLPQNRQPVTFQPGQCVISHSPANMNEGASSGGEKQELKFKRAILQDQNKPENMIQRQQVIRLTYLITAMDLTCLFMQIGIIPYLAKSLGLDSVGFGYLQTTFGVLQLLGGPIFGRFADRCGTRAALTLSYLSGSAFFLLLSISTSIPLLFLSRIPSVFMHGLPGAQMVITDLTTPAERADALGKLGLCFGIGVIIGSSLGGTLSTKFGVYFPSYLAVVASLISAMIVMTCIPAHTKPKSEGQATQQRTSQSSVFSLKEILRLLKLPGVKEVFLIKVLSGLPTGLFLIMFSIISMNFFGLEAAQTGYLMSYFGVLQMVVQGLVIGRLTSRFTERTLIMLSVLAFSGVGLAMALMTNVFHYCIIALPMVFALCTMGIITDSILTKSVPPSDTGAMLGICASVPPLTRTVGPTLGGILYKMFGVSAFGYLQLVVNISLFLYIFKNRVPQNEEKAQ